MDCKYLLYKADQKSRREKLCDGTVQPKKKIEKGNRKEIGRDESLPKKHHGRVKRISSKNG